MLSSFKIFEVLRDSDNSLGVFMNRVEALVDMLDAGRFLVAHGG